jgi:hypothetical protein
MKRIALNNGLFAIVDDDDFEELSKHRWYLYKGRNTHYACRSHYERDNTRHIRMHREIAKAQPLDEVDHINGNGLDNRKCNLRLCSRSQNSWNMVSTRGTSKYKGVSYKKKTKKWKAQINYQNHDYHIGYFSSELDAAIAYDACARILYGDFARLNRKQYGRKHHDFMSSLQKQQNSS